MKLISIEMENFQSFPEQSLDFKNIKVASIYGSYDNNNLRSNGVGKSTIFDAMIYAVYGKSRTQSEDDLIMNQKDSMSVRFKFILNGETIEIYRKKRRDSTGGLFFSINGVDKSEGKRETQDKIVQKIGMDFELFIATIFFQQMNADTFTASTPTVRKEYLKGILRLDVYDKCLDQVKIKISEIESEVTECETTLKYIQDEIGKTDIEEKKAELDKNKKQIESLTEKYNEYSKQLKSYLEIEKLINEIITEGKSLKEDAEELKEKINKLELEQNKNIKDRAAPLVKFDQGRVDEAEAERKDISKKISSLREKISSGNGQIKQLTKRIEMLEENVESKCPLCESDIDQKKRDELKNKIISEIADIENENKKTDFQELQPLYVDLKKIEYRLERFSEDKAAFDKQEKQNIKLDEKINQSRTLIIEYKDKLKDNEEQRATLRESLQKQKDKIKWECTQSMLDEIKDEKQEVIRQCDSLEKEIGLFESKNKEITTLQKKIKALRKNLSIYNTLKGIFGKNGIVAEVIKESIEEIQDTTNEILNDINEGEMMVIFDTVKEVKADKILRDTLEIKIDTGEVQRSYESFSGGEKTIINFAIRLALSKLISKMNGVNFGFIVLDEVFGALDDFNRDKMSKVINYLKNDFNQVFIISHDEMKERFENYIKIIKNNRTGESRIVEVA